MKRFFTFILCLGVLLGCLPNTSYAAVAIDSETADCLNYLYQENLILESDLEYFLNNHFLSDQNTSVLIDDALNKFLLYEEALDLALLQWAQQFDQRSISNQFIDIEICQSWIRTQHKKWSTQIESLVIKTSRAKQTNLLLTTLERINDQLKELNLNIARLKSLIEGFAKNLPCFVSACVTN